MDRSSQIERWEPWKIRESKFIHDMCRFVIHSDADAFLWEHILICRLEDLVWTYDNSVLTVTACSHHWHHEGSTQALHTNLLTHLQNTELNFFGYENCMKNTVIFEPNTNNRRLNELLGREEFCAYWDNELHRCYVNANHAWLLHNVWTPDSFLTRQHRLHKLDSCWSQLTLVCMVLYFQTHTTQMTPKKLPRDYEITACDATNGIRPPWISSTGTQLKAIVKTWDGQTNAEQWKSCMAGYLLCIILGNTSDLLSAQAVPATTKLSTISSGAYTHWWREQFQTANNSLPHAQGISG